MNQNPDFMTNPFTRLAPSGLDTIILLGPIGVGKTTVGKILARWLDCTFTSLDDLEESYTQVLGYDHSHAMKVASTEGGFPYYAYRRSFFEEAVCRFLNEYQSGVIELGGGHPILPPGANQQRIHDSLSPFKHIFLLMPTSDVIESIRFLRDRQGLDEEADDFNELFFQQNTFFELAKKIVYTQNKSPKEVAQEILDAWSAITQ